MRLRLRLRLHHIWVIDSPLKHVTPQPPSPVEGEHLHTRVGPRELKIAKRRFLLRNPVKISGRSFHYSTTTCWTSCFWWRKTKSNSEVWWHLKTVWLEIQKSQKPQTPTLFWSSGRKFMEPYSSSALIAIQYILRSSNPCFQSTKLTMT